MPTDRQTDGRTDKHDNANSCSPQFLERAPHTACNKKLNWPALLFLHAYSRVVHYTINRGFGTEGQGRDSHPKILDIQQAPSPPTMP